MDDLSNMAIAIFIMFIGLALFRKFEKTYYPFSFMDEHNTDPNNKTWSCIKRSFEIAAERYDSVEKLQTEANKYNLPFYKSSQSDNFYFAFGHLYFIDNYQELKKIYFKKGEEEFIEHTTEGSLKVFTAFKERTAKPDTNFADTATNRVITSRKAICELD